MIRLLTVIGHGTKLLPHFIKHYEKYVDEINIVVYESDLHRELGDEISQILIEFTNVKIVKTINERVFDWEKVTQSYNYIKKDYPDDWWVIADIDEFHLYPKDNLKQLISDCEKNNWDIVRGGFIDRIGPDGKFSELQPNESIWKQYPNAGFFRYPMSEACPNKICVVRGYIEITNGQHYTKIDGHTTWRWQGWHHPLIAPTDTHSIQVHHFKWDKSSIERVRNVAMVNQPYAYSSEYRKMYESLRKTKFKIDLDETEYMFEKNTSKPEFKQYKQWNKLIKKIISI
jgi:hypothetical protein